MEETKTIKQKWHQPSIWAFVLSLAGLLIGMHLLSIVAVIMAGISLSAFGKFKAEELPKGKGLAIAGLVIGILGVIVELGDFMNNTRY